MAPQDELLTLLLEHMIIFKHCEVSRQSAVRLACTLCMHDHCDTVKQNILGGKPCITMFDPHDKQWQGQFQVDELMLVGMTGSYWSIFSSGSASGVELVLP